MDERTENDHVDDIDRGGPPWARGRVAGNAPARVADPAIAPPPPTAPEVPASQGAASGISGVTVMGVVVVIALLALSGWGAYRFATAEEDSGSEEKAGREQPVDADGNPSEHVPEQVKAAWTAPEESQLPANALTITGQGARFMFPNRYRTVDLGAEASEAGEVGYSSGQMWLSNTQDVIAIVATTTGPPGDATAELAEHAAGCLRVEEGTIASRDGLEFTVLATSDCGDPDDDGEIAYWTDEDTIVVIAANDIERSGWDIADVVRSFEMT